MLLSRRLAHARPRANYAVPLLLREASVVIDQDIMNAEQMRADAMYNELLIPLGFQWFAGVGFWAESALWGLSIQRTITQGPSRAPRNGVRAAPCTGSTG